MPTAATSRACPICASTEKDHPVGDHALRRTSGECEPLSFVIGVQGFYDSDDTKSRCLARARAELKKYFPDHQFEILPSSFMVVQQNGRIQSAVFGRGEVNCYTVNQI